MLPGVKRDGYARICLRSSTVTIDSSVSVGLQYAPTIITEYDGKRKSEGILNKIISKPKPDEGREAVISHRLTPLGRYSAGTNIYEK